MKLFPEEALTGVWRQALVENADVGSHFGQQRCAIVKARFVVELCDFQSSRPYLPFQQAIALAVT
jgi:hypothetical protein